MRRGVYLGGSIHLPYAALSGVVALLQFRILVFVFGPQYTRCIEAAQGVLRGEPHWRVYQNRLLGPWLVQGVAEIVGSFRLAHVLVAIVLLALSGYLVLIVLSRLHADPARVLAGYFVFSFLVVGCFKPPWLYIWDLTDLLVFVVFNALVVRGRDYRYFMALFAVAIFNRESAYFIAGWMIVDPFVRRYLGRPLELRMAASGTVLLGGGIALVETLRTSLLVREVGPQLVGPVAGAGPRVHFMLPDNLERLGQALTSFRYTMSFLVPLLLVAYLAFCARVAYRDPPGRAGLAAIHVLMIGSLFVFGILFETRIYLVLLPFLVFNLRPETPV